MAQPHDTQLEGLSERKRLLEQQLDPDVHRYWCEPQDASLRAAQSLPLAGCDQIMPRVHVQLSTYYPLRESTRESRARIVQVLRQGLVKLAQQAPYLAATVSLDPAAKRGQVQMTGDGDGILLLATGVDSVRADIPSFAELQRDRFAPWAVPRDKVIPGALASSTSNYLGHDGGLPACILQLNFIDGGAILASGVHHYIANGPGLDLVFRALAAHCAGLPELEMQADRRIVSVPPGQEATAVPELERFLEARGCQVGSTKPDPENPWSNFVSAPMESAMVQFPRRALADLKADIVARDPDSKVSTADCLQAVCWAGMVRAKGSTAAGAGVVVENPSALFPISFRSRRNPGFPSNFCGNATLLNGVSLPLQTLMAPEGAGLAHAATAIRGIVENVDADYFAKAVAWADSIEDPATRTWMTSPPRRTDTAFTSWAGLTSNQNWDLGFGTPAAVRPTALAIPFIVLLPPTKAATGEDVFEAYIAAPEDVHRGLSADPEFRRFASDYHTDIQ